MENLTGIQIDSYRLEQLLFEKGSLQAYLGIHTILKKERTVYLLHHSSETPPSLYVEELNRKARSAAQLDSHLGLVNIHAVGVVDGASFFITDLVPGPNLADILEAIAHNQHALAWEDSLALGERCVRALEHAYIKGGLFVSLHPGTIKFRRDSDRASILGCIPILTDIGIASSQGPRPDGKPTQPYELIREFGLLFHSLLTLNGTYERGTVPAQELLAEAIQAWPAEQAAGVKQLVDRWTQGPDIDFDTARGEIYQALKELRALPPFPAQERLRDVYDRLVQKSDDTRPEFPSVEPAEESTPPAEEFRLIIQPRPAEGAPGLHTLKQGVTLIGRGPERDVVLIDDRVSRTHLRLELSAGEVWLTDLGSTNGSFLDADRLPPHRPVIWPPGQVLRVGATLINLQQGALGDLPASGQKPISDPDAGKGAGDLIIPSEVFIKALGKEVSASEFAILPDNRYVGFYVPGEEIWVEPGQESVVSVYVINFVRKPITLSLTADNVPPFWVSVPESEFTLRGTNEREIAIRIAPPRHPLSRAGPYRLRISLADAGNLGHAERAEISRHIPIRVKSFVEFDSKVEANQTGHRMTVQVSITNRGNGLEKFALLFWSDIGETLDFTLPEEEISVEPNQEAQVEVHVVPKKRALFGAAKKHQISVQISGTQGAPQKHTVEYSEKSRISFG